MNNKEIIAKLYEWSQDDSLEGTWQGKLTYHLFRELSFGDFRNIFHYEGLKIRKHKTNVDKFIEEINGLISSGNWGGFSGKFRTIMDKHNIGSLENES